MSRIALFVLTWMGVATMLPVTSFADIASTRNFYAFSDRLLTSGQPTTKALKSASKDGIEVVINLVPKSESIFNPKEGEILRAQGIEYIHLPVSWRSPKAEDITRFLAAMKRVEGKKVLIHCWANARASAFGYAYQASQMPEKRTVEWARLRKVWKDVAGYNLDRDRVWQSYLKKNVGAVN